MWSWVRAEGGGKVGGGGSDQRVATAVALLLALLFAAQALETEEREREEREFAVLLTRLQSGVKVIKHTRKGQAVERVLWLTGGLIGGRVNVDVKNPMRKHKKGLELNAVVDVQAGHLSADLSAVFQRSVKLRPTSLPRLDPAKCFSLVGHDRTFDIETFDGSGVGRDDLVAALRRVLQRDDGKGGGGGTELDNRTRESPKRETL